MTYGSEHGGLPETRGPGHDRATGLFCFTRAVGGPVPCPTRASRLDRITLPRPPARTCFISNIVTAQEMTAYTRVGAAKFGSEHGG